MRLIIFNIIITSESKTRTNGVHRICLEFSESSPVYSHFILKFDVISILVLYDLSTLFLLLLLFCEEVRNSFVCEEAVSCSREISSYFCGLRALPGVHNNEMWPFCMGVDNVACHVGLSDFVKKGK